VLDVIERRAQENARRQLAARMEFLIGAKLRRARQILNRGHAAFTRLMKNGADLCEPLLERNRCHGFAHDRGRRSAQQSGQSSPAVAHELAASRIGRGFGHARKLQRETVGQIDRLIEAIDEHRMVGRDVVDQRAIGHERTRGT
jgi:hypothetical protein